METILVFINHGDLIFSGPLSAECWIKIGLTCLVHYSVASLTAIRAQMENRVPAYNGLGVLAYIEISLANLRRRVAK